MLVRLQVMFKRNIEISFVKFKISISALLYGTKINDCRFFSKSVAFLQDNLAGCQHPVSVRMCRLR